MSVILIPGEDFQFDEVIFHQQKGNTSMPVIYKGELYCPHGIICTAYLWNSLVGAVTARLNISDYRQNDINGQPITWAQILATDDPFNRELGLKHDLIGYTQQIISVGDQSLAIAKHAGLNREYTHQSVEDILINNCAEASRMGEANSAHNISIYRRLPQEA